MGWIAMRSLLELIEAARSTEPMAIVEALESWRIPDGAMPVYYRKWDHQFVHRMLILKVKRHIPDAWDYFDVIEFLAGDAGGDPGGIRHRAGHRLSHAHELSCTRQSLSRI